MARAVLNLTNHSVLPPRFGTAKVIYGFLTELSKRNKVILYSTKGNEVEEKFPHFMLVNRFPSWFYGRYTLLIGWLYIPELCRIVSKAQIDVIIVSHALIGWMGLLLRALTRKPFIVHSLNIDSLRYRSMGKRWWRIFHAYEGFIYRCADLVLFISPEEQSYAVSNMGVTQSKTLLCRAGIEESMTSTIDKQAARSRLGLPMDLDIPILLFFGKMDYKPNSDAVYDIRKNLLPRLFSKKLDFRLIIAGQGLSESCMQQIKCPHTEYLGFVEDLPLLLRASDLCLNPVLTGAGVKTKVIESLANHLNVLSFETGASGIPLEVTGNKLTIVPDRDWDRFATEVERLINSPASSTPREFFELHSWEQMVNSIEAKIDEIVANK